MASETHWDQTAEDLTADLSAPVLVAVLNNPADLARAEAGWYRIPLSRAPERVAADYLAFYQTGAFPEGERWCIRRFAPVSGYRITTRRALLPEEGDHPRAELPYYRIDLRPLRHLESPVPSRRLRRVTFISTTLGRLLEATEINDLWIRTASHDRLWEAMKAAQIEAEREYPVQEDDPDQTIDFALFPPDGPVGIMIDADPSSGSTLRDRGALGYLRAADGWRMLRLNWYEAQVNAAEIVRHLLSFGVRQFDH